MKTHFTQLFALSLMLVFCRPSLGYDDFNGETDIFDAGASSDGKLNFTGIVHKYGKKVESYEVTTEDGCILTLFRIPGNKKYPVYLQHGLVDSADGFVLRGKTSLAFYLSDAGFDVWVGNARGNVYSDRHLFKNPKIDPSYWEFSEHEYGHYDVAAQIDKALEVTGAKKLSYIGHSEGTAMFLVLMSTRPEYNHKVNLFLAMAPICYLNNVREPLNFLLSVARPIVKAAKALGLKKLFGEGTVADNILDVICNIPEIGYKVCADGGVFLGSGYDADNFDSEFLHTYIGHYPQATCVQNLEHFVQTYDKEQFAQFDYGPVKNTLKYGRIEPPLYDLKKVTVPTVLFTSDNDEISTPKDTERLGAEIGNLICFHHVGGANWNHIDYTLGKDAHIVLYPYLVEMLRKYNAFKDI